MATLIASTRFFRRCLHRTPPSHAPAVPKHRCHAPRHRIHIANPQARRNRSPGRSRGTVSALFTASVTGLPSRCSICARSRSGAGNLRAPVHQENDVRRRFQRHLRLLQNLARECTPGRRITMPPVSMTSKRRPSCSAHPWMRSRVIPGSSPTIDAPLPRNPVEKSGLSNVGPAHNDHRGSGVGHEPLS